MNKNGWGLRVELLYILMFLFCLVVATIGPNRLGLLGENPDALIKPDTEEKEVYSYEPLERKVVEAAKKYYAENPQSKINSHNKRRAKCKRDRIYRRCR